MGTLTLLFRCIITNLHTSIALVLIITSAGEDDLVAREHGVELLHLLNLTAFITCRLNIFLLILLFIRVNIV